VGLTSIARLVAASVNPFIDDRERSTQLESLADHRSLVQFARRLRQAGVAGQAYSFLERSQSLGLLSADAQMDLKRSYAFAERRNKRLFRILARVLDRAAAESVEMVVTRGPRLLATSYKNGLGTRTFADIDVWVRPNMVGSARNVISAALGAAVHHSGRSRALDADRVPSCREIIRCGRVHFDLHWNPSRSYSFCRLRDEPSLNERIWQDARLSERAGWYWLEFSPEVELALLCRHLAVQHDLTEGVTLGFLDLAMYLLHFHEELDWARVMQLASSLHIRRPVSAVLRMLPQVFEGSEKVLPPHLMTTRKHLRERIILRITVSPAMSSAITRTFLRRGSQFLRRYIASSMLMEDDAIRFSFMRALFLPRAEDMDLFLDRKLNLAIRILFLCFVYPFILLAFAPSVVTCLACSTIDAMRRMCGYHDRHFRHRTGQE